MKALHVAAAILTAAIMSVGGRAAEFAKPDFAFPEKVNKQAEQQLKKARKKNDAQGAVRALIDMSIADLKVSDERCDAVIARLNENIKSSKDDIERAMLNLYLASVYSSIYQNQSWVYNRRNLPLTPVPDNVAEWSGDQFRAKVRELTDAALADPMKLLATPLREWKGVVTIGYMTETYYPTLFDFASHSAINSLSEAASRLSPLPYRCLTLGGTEFTSPKIDTYSGHILNLYDTWVNLNEKRSLPAFMNADINRIRFLMSTTNGNDSKNLLLELADKYADSEWSGDALLAYILYDSQDEIVAKARELLEKFPTYPHADELKNYIMEATQPKVEVNSMDCVPPQAPQKLQVKMSNLNKAILAVYKVKLSKNETYFSFSPTASYEKIAEIPVEATGTAPFTATLTTEYSFPEVGTYVIVPTIDGSVDKRQSYHAVTVTKLALVAASDPTEIWVVDPADGSPVSGAELFEISSRSKNDKNLGVVSAGGMLLKTSKEFMKQYYARHGSDSSVPVSVYNDMDLSPDSVVISNIFTSLPLYRPGDEVEFSAAMIVSTRRGKHFFADREVKIEMYDANYQLVDSLTANTDKWGRIYGRFKLPENSLQGRYRLKRVAKDSDEYTSQCSFMVSDYKLPTFNVELESPLQQRDGSFIIKGIARLYSGFPVENATVKIAVNTSMRFARFGADPSMVFCSLDTTTDSDGRFEVKLTDEDMAYALSPSKFFTATATVTLPTGESCVSSVNFCRGNFVKVMVELPLSIDISKPVKLPVKTYDSQNKEIDVPVSYAVSLKDSTMLTSTVTPEADWSALSSGLAQIKFTAAGDTTVCEAWLYKPTDKESPSSDLIWTPETEITTDGKGKASILIWTTAKCRALYILQNDTNAILTKWIDFAKGRQQLQIELPNDISSTQAVLTAVGDYRAGNLRLNIYRPEKTPAIDIEIESFRNHMIPGDTENWTIRVTDTDNKGVESAVILDMWNKSVSAIASPVFKLSTDFYFGYRERTISVPDFRKISSVYRESLKLLKGKPTVTPYFNQWDYSGGRLVSRTSYNMKMANKKVMICGSKAVSIDEAPAFEFAASTANVNMAESADEDGGVQAAGATQAEPEGFSYRDAETPLAFFKPMLTTNADGVLEYSFTVPNANATWVLNALAVSKELLVDSKELTTISSKPVMIEPSLPRFLRAGDRLSIPALVINNSESAVTVVTEIELFNAATNETIVSKSFTNSLEAGKSTIVSLDFTTPADISLLGYRAKSTAGAFSDGEQSAIAVLPSTTRVIESLPFYMVPDSTTMTLTVPPSGDDARVTLTFCENPTWLVVSALPGILEGSPKTSPDAARHIYSAAVAAGLLRNNPALGRAIQQWEENPSDSTLTSMLSRNADLKKLLLEATPWVGDAASDTERMARLSLILNRSNIDSEVASSVKVLAKLVDKGGLKWSEGSAEASEWATMRVLDLLGRLNAAGWLPADKELRRQVNEAVVWLDARIAERYRKYPNGNYVDYVVVRDRFPAIKQSTAAARATDATVQQLIGRWRDLPLQAKATAALVLENHSYHATAMQILSSLREYASTSPEKGMWWPKLTDNHTAGIDANSATATILEAFATVDPTSADVNMIRQWLILQKEAQNWGKSTDATTVVAAILSTSPKWLTNARGATITVNNCEITPAKVEKALGSFSADITAEASDGATLRINRPGNTPSWGAVVRSFTDSIVAVKAASVDGLSIEKRLYPLNDSGAATNFTGELANGSKVRVEILVKCDRPIDYVTVTDERPACFEPVEQLPGYMWSEGIGFYRVNADTETSIFIDRLPKGTYLLTYDMWVTAAGRFIDGIATIQSQYQPAITAHSAASTLTVR